VLDCLAPISLTTRQANLEPRDERPNPHQPRASMNTNSLSFASLTKQTSRRIKFATRSSPRKTQRFCTRFVGPHTHVQNSGPSAPTTYIKAQHKVHFQNPLNTERCDDLHIRLDFREAKPSHFAVSISPIAADTTGCGVQRFPTQIPAETQTPLVSICTRRYSTQAYTTHLHSTSPQRGRAASRRLSLGRPPARPSL
jgi:hypothetical protein